MEENWVPVPGYEGSYECSSEGRVRSLDRMVNSRYGYKKPVPGIILKTKIAHNGYVHVVLCKSRKASHKLLHRVVYESFNGKTNLQVDHINNVKTDCRLSNLQALSSHDNNLKAKARKFKTSKYAGVNRYYNKWRAQIGIKGVKYHLGYFDNELDAHNAYLKARP